MRRFLTLMHAEWRATRALCVFLAVAASFALVAFNAVWTSRDTGRWWGGWPVVGVAAILGIVATVAAVIAASTFASDAQRDASHPLAHMPTGPWCVFVAKFAFVFAATAGIATCACTTTLAVLAAWRGSAAVAFCFADVAAALPWCAVACVPAIFVATCATLGMRGMTALFAGATLPAVLAFAATRVELRPFGIAVRPDHVAWCCAFVGVVFFGSAWVSFRVGFTRVATLMRRTVVTLAAIVLPLTCVASAGAVALREIARAEPGENIFSLALVSLSPDERFAVVCARARRSFFPLDSTVIVDARSTWVVDLESGHTVVLPGVDHSPIVPTGWIDNESLSFAFRRLEFFSNPPNIHSDFDRLPFSDRAVFDARTGAVLRSVDESFHLSLAEWRARQPSYERKLVDRAGWTEVVDVATERVERSFASGRSISADRFESLGFPEARRSDRFALHSVTDFVARQTVTTVIDLVDGSEHPLDAAAGQRGTQHSNVAFLRDGRTLLIDEHESLCLREIDGSLHVLVAGSRP